MGSVRLSDALCTATGSTTARSLADHLADVGAVPGLVANSAAAAASNTAKIQAALDRGGRVLIGPVGAQSATYYVTAVGGAYASTAALAIGSDTHLVVAPNVTLKQAAGAERSLLVTKAFAAAKTAVTVAWTSGSTATVTWTSHPFAYGDFIAMQGANQSAFVGVFTVIGVPTANTITVQLTETPVAAASGTIVAVKANVNVQVEGGTWDYNYAENSNPTGTHAHAIILAYAQGVRAHGQRYVSVPKYCLNVGAVRDYDIAHQHAVNGQVAMPKLSDIVKVYGPAFNGTVAFISGVSGDDNTSVQAVEPAAYAAYMFTGGGSVVGYRASNIGADNVATTAVAVYLPKATSPWRMDDIVVEATSGNSLGSQSRIKIAGDPDTGDQGSRGGTITVRGSRPVGRGTGTFGKFLLVDRYTNIEHLRVENVVVDDAGYTVAQSDEGIQLFGRADVVTLSGSTFRNIATAVNVEVTAWIGVLAIRDVNLERCGRVVNVNAYVGVLTVSDAYLRDLTEAVLTHAGVTVDSVVLERVKADQVQGLFHSQGGTIASIAIQEVALSTRIQAVSVSVAAGGAGYQVGDTITLAGGTAYTATVLTVSTVSGGAVTVATVTTPGEYRSRPGDPVAQGSTSGGGAGATFNVTWLSTFQPRLVWFEATSTVGTISVARNKLDSGCHSLSDLSSYVSGVTVNATANNSAALIGVAANKAMRLNVRDNTFSSGNLGILRMSDATALEAFTITGSGNVVGSQPTIVRLNGGELVTIISPDLKVDLASVQRTAGSMAVASVGAGTIVANNLAVCDATGAAGSWKQVTNTANTY